MNAVVVAIVFSLAVVSHLAIIIFFVLFSEIAFQSDQNKLDAWTTLGDLCEPLRSHILERVSVVDLSSRVRVSSAMRALEQRKAAAKMRSKSSGGHTLKHSIMACVSL